MLIETIKNQEYITTVDCCAADFKQKGDKYLIGCKIDQDRRTKQQAFNGITSKLFRCQLDKEK